MSTPQTNNNREIFKSLPDYPEVFVSNKGNIASSKYLIRTFVRNKGTNTLVFKGFAICNKDTKSIIITKRLKNIVARLFLEVPSAIKNKDTAIVVCKDGDYDNCSVENLKYAVRGTRISKKLKCRTPSGKAAKKAIDKSQTTSPATKIQDKIEKVVTAALESTKPFEPDIHILSILKQMHMFNKQVEKEGYSYAAHIDLRTMQMKLCKDSK